MTTRPDLRSGAERRSLESIAMTMSWVVGAALPVVSRPVRAVRLTGRARNLRATHRWSRRHCTRRRIGERVDNPRGQIDGPPEDGACCFPFISRVGHRRHLLLAEQGACRWVLVEQAQPSLLALAAVVTIRVDEVGIDRALAPIAEDPGCFPPQWTGRHGLQLAHELGEVVVGPNGVGFCKNEVVPDEDSGPIE